MPLLIATDGTPQSEGAVAFARLLPVSDRREVTLLTVVDGASDDADTALSIVSTDGQTLLVLEVGKGV